MFAASVFEGFVFVGAFFTGFLERGIFPHLFRLFICVRLCLPLGCLGVSLSLWAPFSPLCVRLISAHDRFTAVTVRHEPSRIVAVHFNLATRLGSSRSANFFRGSCTLPEVHFRYPFSRHDFRCHGRDSR